MHRQAHVTERLDGRLDDEPALDGNLRDLRRINDRLGGSQLSARALKILLGPAPRQAALLDVGTGAADIPLALVRSAREWGCALSVVAVDSRPEVIAAARRLDRRLGVAAGGGFGVSLGVVDARRLPWAAGTFDVGHASLLLHHLEPAGAVELLAELGRVSRGGVVVNDLARGRLWWAIAWAGSRLLTRNQLTRHDAPLSVRRAYTVAEAEALLHAAGLRTVAVVRGRFGHRFAIAAVRAEGGARHGQDRRPAAGTASSAAA